MLYSGLVGLIVGAALVWYFMPAAATKASSQQTTNTKYEIITQEKIVQKPGGVVEIVRTITDTSVKTEKASSSVVSINRKDYLLQISAGSQLRKLEPVYAVYASRRIIGSIFAGAYGRTDGEFGAILSLEF